MTFIREQQARLRVNWPSVLAWSALTLGWVIIAAMIVVLFTS